MGYFPLSDGLNARITHPLLFNGVISVLLKLPMPRKHWKRYKVKLLWRLRLMSGFVSGLTIRFSMIFPYICTQPGGRLLFSF